MKLLVSSLSALTVVLLASCASRTDFTPDSGPPTVGMPAQLSDIERTFIREVDGTLRNEGYLPVRHGAGDMQLEFEIAQGPINTDTTIELYENRSVIAKGFGRAAGAPMIGRAKVAEKSFNRAYEEFRSSLPNASSAGSSSPSYDSNHSNSGEAEYVY